MRNGTKQVLTRLALAASLAATAGLADALAANEGGDPAPTAPSSCLKAEVNPVTGHVLCIDPLGAPVEPPPSASDVPCKPGAHADQAWTWRPKCKSEKPGEG